MIGLKKLLGLGSEQPSDPRETLARLIATEIRLYDGSSVGNAEEWSENLRRSVLRGWETYQRGCERSDEATAIFVQALSTDLGLDETGLRRLLQEERDRPIAPS